MLKYPRMHTVLIVEDKESMARMLEETLVSEGYRVLVARDTGEGISTIRKENIDLLLTDLKLPGGDGISLLKASKEDAPLRPVIVMTAHGSVETAVSAMKEGAFDFVTKPLNIDHLLMLIRRAIENQMLLKENMLLKDEFSSRLGLPNIIGKSPSMLDAAEKIQRAAPTKTTVLLLGESGTGKELFARALHNLSGRRDYPFVPINCAAIPKELLEAELFGFEKGSFTGAGARKTGKFELADRGTVFLDEVGELDTGLQAKLLRAVQEGEIERIGGTKTIKIDVRVVAATNKDLERALAEGSFREDLYYRLNVFPISIPPLRQRREDIPLLTEHFIRKYSSELGKEEMSFSPEAIGVLMEQDWKGNVRELENTIERAMILCDGKSVLTEHISPKPQQPAPLGRPVPLDGSLDEVSRGAQRSAETLRIRKALEDFRGNKTKAAQALKVSYKTLLTKIKDYGIRWP